MDTKPAIDDPRSTWEIVFSILITVGAYTTSAVAFVIGSLVGSDRPDAGTFWIAVAIYLLLVAQNEGRVKK